MALFFNQASLSYNGNTINSNIVTGEIVEVLEGAKTAIPTTYTVGDEVTFAISLVNSGTTALNGLTVNDNLGQYAFGAGFVVPLDFIPDTVRLFVNGELQATPTVTDTNPLEITGINIPANGNAVLVYKARANQFAPIGEDGNFTNSALISGAGLTQPVSVASTLTASDGLNLDITKAVSPDTVAENGELTYTFTIQNTGATAATAADDLVITDTFDPVLNITSVTFNGTPWAEGTNYTYNEATGLFTTTAGQITVPAATYEQDPGTGAYVITPGTSVIRVTGTI